MLYDCKPIIKRVNTNLFLFGMHGAGRSPANSANGK